MAYALETMDLTKVYKHKEAVRSVNLHIPEGQIYGLIGRNGAGKTTIMRIISGLASPTAGSYAIFGKTGRDLGRMLRSVGVLIEQPGIYPKLSGYENLKIKCLGMGVKPAGYVEELLRTVGLEDVDRKLPAGSYSLGMRQRLGIALALAGDPKIIILDEPINGLDPQGIVEVRQTLTKLRTDRGITSMVSSHILDELSRVADVYGIINEGNLLDEFTADELSRRSGQCVMIRTDDTVNAIRALMAINVPATPENDGTLRVTEELDNPAAMARAIVEAGVALREIFVRTISLEDYYLGVTGGNQHG